MIPGIGWTTERVEALILHFNDGWSAAQSAKVIGAVTRNAVIGKRLRMGLVFGQASAPVRPSPARRPPLPPRAAERAPRPLRAPPVRDVISQKSMLATARNIAVQMHQGNFKTAAPATDERPRASLTEIATPFARPWIERENGQCAFPVSGTGEAPLSCCAPVGRQGQTWQYCPDHVDVMGAKPVKWQRDAARLPRAYDTAAA